MGFDCTKDLRTKSKLKPTKTGNNNNYYNNNNNIIIIILFLNCTISSDVQWGFTMNILKIITIIIAHTVLCALPLPLEESF